MKLVLTLELNTGGLNTGDTIGIGVEITCGITSGPRSNKKNNIKANR